MSSRRPLRVVTDPKPTKRYSKWARVTWSSDPPKMVKRVEPERMTRFQISTWAEGNAAELDKLRPAAVPVRVSVVIFFVLMAAGFVLQILKGTV